MHIVKLSSWLLIAFVLLISCNDNINAANKGGNKTKNNESVGGSVTTQAVTDSTNMWVYANGKVKISSDLFGVNNDWAQITDSEFSSFVSALNGINYSMMRFPGGWESEYYDWDTNTTPGWNKIPDTPGASVSTLKLHVDNYTIVVPTAAAMNETLWTTEWWNAVADLKAEAENAINKVGPNDVKIVEIGNEWWLQWGGSVSRSEKLTKYVKTAMNIANYLDQEFPNKSFKLLINGDYTNPEEFTTMKNKFTKAYDVIDGVALHTYAGYQTFTHNMEDLSSRIQACADNFNTNKNFIYLSEWAPSKDYNDGKIYMEAANIIPDLFHIYARSGADAAAYWPPVNVSIPGLGLFNNDFSTTWPTGQIFGEMVESYTGHAVSTTYTDSIRVAGARPNNDKLVLFVPGGDNPATNATIKVNGFTINMVEGVTKFRPDDYSQTDKAAPYVSETASVNLNSDTNEISFDINTSGKYEIYKIVLTK